MAEQIIKQISECQGCGKIMPYDPELYIEGKTGEPFCRACKEANGE